MAYKVELTSKALKSLKKIDKRTLIRIAKLIDSLQNDPRPNGVKKMQGFEDRYRVRDGNYRVIYQIHDGQLLVLVIDIGQRKDIYR